MLTKSITSALTLAHNIDSGTVWINTYGAVFPQTVRPRGCLPPSPAHHWLSPCTRVVACHVQPFGGFKQSGIGRENGYAVLQEYMQVKTITIGGLSLPKL